MTLREQIELIQATAASALANIPVDAPNDQPPPPTSTRVTTALELAIAVNQGGTVVVAPGVYKENLLIRRPVHLIEEQPGTVTLQPREPTEPTLTVLSDNVIVEGFQIQNGHVDYETVCVGSWTETDPLQQPDDVTFLRTVLTAGILGGVRGFVLHARRTLLKDCEALGFVHRDKDAQGVLILNGPGPHTIDGGTFESSGENIMLGGASIPTGLNPSAMITGVTLSKPLTWKGRGYRIKNLFEVKAGIGVTLGNCILDGCWGGEGQAGHPIVLTPRNQDGDNPWVQVDQIVIRNNRVMNCPDGYAVNILGSDDSATSQPTRQITIEGNLFADSRGGVQVIDAAELALVIRRNTFAGIERNFLGLSGPAIASLIFEQNVTRAGEYGIWGDDNQTIGLPSLQAAVQALTWQGNFVEHHPARTLSYPAGTRLLKPGELAPLLDENFKMRDGSAGY